MSLHILNTCKKRVKECHIDGCKYKVLYAHLIRKQQLEQPVAHFNVIGNTGIYEFI